VSLNELFQKANEIPAIIYVFLAFCNAAKIKSLIANPYLRVKDLPAK
jgi:hypothetical protein